MAEPTNADILNAISNIATRIGGVETSISELGKKVDTKNAFFESQLKEHDKKFESAYKKEVRKNIVIFGWKDMESKPKYVLREKFLELIHEKLLLKEVRNFDIHNIKTAGKKNNIVIVTLCSSYLAQTIVSKGFRLAGSDIFLEYDLSSEEREIKKKLLNYKKDLKAKGEISKVTKYNTLKINGQQYSLDQLDAGKINEIVPENTLSHSIRNQPSKRGRSPESPQDDSNKRTNLNSSDNTIDNALDMETDSYLINLRPEAPAEKVSNSTLTQTSIEPFLQTIGSESANEEVKNY